MSENMNSPSMTDLEAQIAQDEIDRNNPVEDVTEIDDPVEEADSVTEEPVEEPVEETKSDDDYQKRISRLAYEAREAKKIAKSLKEEVERLRGNAPPLPKDEQYSRDVEAAANQQSQRQTIHNESVKILSDGKAQYKDFESTLSELGRNEVIITDQMVEAALEAGDAHKIFYYLGKNVDEAERITSLSPQRMGAAMAKIANRVNQPAPKPLSKLPPPITPIAGRGRAEVADDKMSIEEYMRKEDARMYDRKRR